MVYVTLKSSILAVLLTLICVSTTKEAKAVEVTDIPQALRGDVSISYDGLFGRQSLVDGGVDAGLRSTRAHDLTVTAEFAPVDGISFFASIPTNLSTVVQFPEAYTMVVDPVTGDGQYMTSEPLTSPPDYRGNGGRGLWFGFGFAPYSEQFKRSSQLTWRLNLAARTRASQSFWDVVDGQRGANIGGAAYRISGAFSANNGTTRPFMNVDWTLETRRSVQVEVNNETFELQVKPGSRIWIKTGLEIPFKQVDTSEKVESYIEWNMGFGYRSWREYPSGIYLPNVLPSSQSISVTQTDALLGATGLFLGVRVPHYFQWRTGVQVLYETPHLIEDVYNVKTGADSYTIHFHTGFSVGYR